MSKIIIGKDNNVTVQIEVTLGEVYTQKENTYVMTIDTDAGMQIMKDNIYNILKKKKLTQDDKEDLENYLHEYVKYSLMDIAGVKSYPIVQNEHGRLVNVNEDTEVVRE